MAAVPSPRQPWIKVCGVRSEADLEACAAAGATHVGINTWPGSPRCATPGAARDLVFHARRVGLSPVLLYVYGSALTPQDALDLLPDFLQTRVRPEASLAAELAAAGVALIESRTAGGAGLSAPPWGQVLLLDTPSLSAEGGTGRTFDWALTASAPRPFVLAGGLGPDNVGEAIASTRTAGVDSASGLESSPGVKDPARVLAFCRAARAGFEEILHAL
jgi:phosphoribosylanthranilate isomerase